MSTLKVNTIRHTGASSDAVTLATDGTCTAKITNNLSNRNLIINGAVAISQRNSTSNTTIGSGATYGPDRIAARTQTGSGHTLAQTEDGPAGFKYSAKVTIGTGGSPSAANKNYLYQPIEGNNVAHLGSGTSSAETVTLSFWVKSSLTGNFGAAITSGAADHSYTFPYTISSANTWEKKTKTIALPTSGGNWATNNSAGLTVFWDLGSGTDFEGTANQWNSAFDVRASSDVKLMATNSATLYVTGIQLEVGDVATDFEHRSYGDELLRCQRYYNRYQDGADKYLGSTTFQYNSSICIATFRFSPEMRTTPTVDAANGTNYFINYANNGSGNFDSWSSINGMTSRGGCVNAVVSGTSGHAGGAYLSNSSAYIAFNAEL